MRYSIVNAQCGSPCWQCVAQCAMPLQFVVFAGLLAWTAARYAPTFDEIALLPCGINHWQTGTFNLYRVNPPLVRMVAALPATIQGTLPGTPAAITNGPYERPEFKLGLAFQKGIGSRLFWEITIARWACLPLGLLGGLMTYHWSHRLFGRKSAFIALLTFCWCPNVMTWAATITPDAGAASLGCCAGFTYWCWWYRPVWSRAFLAGAVLGLALLTKSTWIMLFPLWTLLWCLRLTIPRQCRTENPDLRSESPITAPGSECGQLAIMFGIALFLLNAGYCFEGSFQPIKEFDFISKTLGGPHAHEVPGNRFRETFLRILPVPFPANYVLGIDCQKFEFEYGKMSFLRGSWKHGGWWYYYIYAFAVKTPLSILVLLVIAGFMTILSPQCRAKWRSELVLIAPCLGVFLLVSSQTGFNRYYRYALPALPFLYIWISKVGCVFDGRSRILKGIVVICVVWAFASTLSTVPFAWSYFNEAAGGPMNGWKHLIDSNIDSGQDLLELKRWYDGHPEARPLHLKYYGWVDPQMAGIAYNAMEDVSIRRFRPDDRSVAQGPQPGWYAVSVNYLSGARETENEALDFSYFQRFAPMACAGYSIYIYHLEMADVDRVRRGLGLSEVHGQ